MLADRSIAAPDPIRAVYAAERWTAMSCYLRQMTWRLDRDTRCAISRSALPATTRCLFAEAERTRWAADVVVAWAEGLRGFHDCAPVPDCPFGFRLDHAFEHVRRRVVAGIVDPGDDFNDDHCHFPTSAAALAELERLCPDDEDLVVCHGDYCPPNALLDRGRVVGYVDLGELAVADRWWDLAVGTWSTTWNVGPGLESLFLAVYGAKPDPDRRAFYRPLFDLVS